MLPIETTIENSADLGLNDQISNNSEQPQNGFAEMALDARVLAALDYTIPSPIQREAIPSLLLGKDLVGLAGTGTGKTAAFALPIIHRLLNDSTARKSVSVLVLIPTRELAIQVAKSFAKYSSKANLEVLAVYGGSSYADQIKAIRRGAQIIVATPGRALDLVRQGKLALNTVRAVVLDEADEMLDMGFAEDIDAILAETPAERQTMLFSATMPPRIEQMAQRHLKNPIRVQVAREQTAPGEEARVRQVVYMVKREHKLAALARVLDVERPTSAIIFCQTRSAADELTEMLHQRNFQPLALHGGMSQEQRDRVMKRFRSENADLLIATDIAARGLDISHLSHVINFDVPQQAEAYVHRTGRVGRAGRAGVAITLATPREQGLLKQIERLLKTNLTIESVPTNKQLQEARQQRTREKLQEALKSPAESGELARLLGDLANEYTAQQLLHAALTLLAEPVVKEETADIPNAYRSGPVNDRPMRGGSPSAGGGTYERKKAGGRPSAKGMSKLYFGIGRDARVGPGDLVGAIANETGIAGKDLGTIDLTDRFALVEVPQELAGYVIEVMDGARIKGRKVHVRADRAPRGGY
ncbi:MAG: DEAD/DEAH box helicase [Zavarzinella sp.]